MAEGKRSHDDENDGGVERINSPITGITSRQLHPLWKKTLNRVGPSRRHGLRKELEEAAPPLW